MSKLKTHKSLTKRLKLTGSGKIKRQKQQKRNNSHLKSKNRAQRKSKPDNLVITSKGNLKRIKSLLSK